MDSAERRELLKRLDGATEDPPYFGDLGFFFEKELLAAFEGRENEPSSPLYDVASIFESFGYRVLDVCYGEDGTSVIVDYEENPDDF